MRTSSPSLLLLRAALFASLTLVTACGDDTVDPLPVEAGPNKDATADGGEAGAAESGIPPGDGGGGDASSEGSDGAIVTDGGGDGGDATVGTEAGEVGDGGGE